MKSLVLLLYFLALATQIGAAVISFAAYRFIGKYRIGWIILALGLTLMAGRRITPILNIESTGHYDLIDAILAVIISGLLIVGVYAISKIVKDWQLKGFQLEKLLAIDYLTQVFSKAEIIKRGEIEIERCKRTGDPLAILELDIDHFKNVNDQYGHQAGDDVLRCLCQHCVKSLREIDLFGRIGGEEFLAILPNTNVEQAFEVAERIRCEIEGATHKTSCNHHLKITVSIGITVYFPKDKVHKRKKNPQILKVLMKNADEAMYQAKSAGRNQVATR